MKYLLPSAVLMLTLSTGMSLDGRQFIANWRRLTPAIWARLLLATFLIPPGIALLLGTLLPIGTPALAGLFLIAVAPGAPLMTRNAARRGFDMQLAASYQLWGALIAPIAIPALVGGAAWLYGRGIWIPPREVLRVVAEKQFAPLLAGMALMRFAPGFSTTVRRPLNIVGNAVLTVALIGLLIKLGPELKAVSLWVALAAVLLAASSLVVPLLILPSAPTLAVSNVNRHVGLALLLSATHFQNAQRVLPAIAAYALAAVPVMILAARCLRRTETPEISAVTV